MAVAGAGVQLVAAATLVVAACRKAAAPRDTRAAVAALQLGPSGSLVAALVTAELLAATALVVAPDRRATWVLVAGLGLLFAGVGVRTHLRGQDIRCACFGTARHALGLRQAAVLPLWLAAAVMPRVLGTELKGREGLLALAAAVTTIAVGAAVPVLRTAVASQAVAREAAA